MSEHRPEHREVPDGHGLRVAIAVSRFNATVTSGLLDGARGALREAGVAEAEILVVHVPGALELPVVLTALARRRQHHALIALGAVIGGDTDHYEHVCREAMHGLSELARSGVRDGQGWSGPLALGNGLLTCRTAGQARERCAPDARNKGAEAARSALEVARLLSSLSAPDNAAPAQPRSPKQGAS